MTIPAKYENGVFRPLAAVEIRERTVVEVRVPVDQSPAGGRRSIKDLPFFGMWKDRDDIPDGVEYVNRLRDNPAASGTRRDAGQPQPLELRDDRRIAV